MCLLVQLCPPVIPEIRRQGGFNPMQARKLRVCPHPHRALIHMYGTAPGTHRCLTHPRPSLIPFCACKEVLLAAKVM